MLESATVATHQLRPRVLDPASVFLKQLLEFGIVAQPIHRWIDPQRGRGHTARPVEQAVEQLNRFRVLAGESVDLGQRSRYRRPFESVDRFREQLGGAFCLGNGSLLFPEVRQSARELRVPRSVIGRGPDIVAGNFLRRREGRLRLGSATKFLMNLTSQQSLSQKAAWMAREHLIFGVAQRRQSLVVCPSIRAIFARESARSARFSALNSCEAFPPVFVAG